MKLGLAVAVAATLIACGGEDDGGSPLSWSGRYEGNVTSTLTTGGQTQSDVSPSVMTILQQGNTLTWSVACGATAVADVSGSRASVRSYTCSKTEAGAVTTITMTGGTLDLGGDTLRVDLWGVGNYAGNGASSSCSLTIKGALKRAAYAP